jgi:hypothetical protein
VPQVRHRTPGDGAGCIDGNPQTRQAYEFHRIRASLAAFARKRSGWLFVMAYEFQSWRAVDTKSFFRVLERRDIDGFEADPRKGS